MYAKKLFLGKLYLFSFVNLQTVKDGLHKQLVEFYEKEEGEERSEVSNNDDAQIATNAEEGEEEEEEGEEDSLLLPMRRPDSCPNLSEATAASRKGDSRA